MAKKRIFTVGFTLPGDEFEYVEFASNQTLLDSDIILFEPTLGSISEEYDHRRGGSMLFSGVPVLTEHSSFQAKKQIDHWRSEIIAAVSAGKLVIVYLNAPVERYRYTGEKNYSGTGKSRVGTPVVTPISSYGAVPNLKKATPKFGTTIRLEKDAGYLAQYWHDFSDYSPYQVEIEGEFSKVLLRAHAGDRTVGAAFHGKVGTLLLLPPLQYDDEKFLRDAEEEDERYWTEDALRFGKSLVATLVALSDALKSSSQVTPIPDWSLSSEYRLAREGEFEADITACAADIAKLQSTKAKFEKELATAGNLRRLLFEQGKPLESVVLEVMGLFGFDAEAFSKDGSEFDGLFVSSEGRCLGEVEGKDNKPINIEKFSQLERNLNEDFDREEVKEHAKGLMFGNAFRLKPVLERGDFFTEKCVSAAKRIGAALNSYSGLVFSSEISSGKS